MRSWRRASKWLDCGGPEPHCRIEAGAPYQRVELTLGTIKDRCVEHASEPVNQAQLDAFDAQHSRRVMSAQRVLDDLGIAERRGTT